MCLIVFSWQPQADEPLTLLANRDEFYARPTEPMHWWQEAPALLAGRDLLGGGTWLGLTRDGRFAALTNFRDGRAPRPQPGAPSRGLLVAGFLHAIPGKAPAAPRDYLNDMASHASAYAGFNLLAGDLAHGQLACLSHSARETNHPADIAPGLHGLSNAVLDTPWPKVEHRKQALAQALHTHADDDTLLALMHDATLAPDDRLPETGIALDRERELSAAFIRTPNYGTRSTTLLRLRHDGQLRVVEETHDPQSGASERRHFALTIKMA